MSRRKAARPNVVERATAWKHLKEHRDRVDELKRQHEVEDLTDIEVDDE